MRRYVWIAPSFAWILLLCYKQDNKQYISNQICSFFNRFVSVLFKIILSKVYRILPFEGNIYNKT